MLYEKNLTPSVAKSTYRQDILDADFVIFIFSNRYGTKTENGISGTHEEWNIVKTLEIPCHVYLKDDYQENKDKELSGFEKKELYSSRVSFYQYKTDEELLSRIKETSFQIAHEIAYSKLDKANVETNVIRRLAINKDQEILLNIIRPIEEIITTSPETILKTTDILKLIMEKHLYPNIEKHGLFIDIELNKMFSSFVKYCYVFWDQQKEIYMPGYNTPYSLNSCPNITKINQFNVYPSKALYTDALDKPYEQLLKEYNRLKERLLKLVKNKLLIY